MKHFLTIKDIAQKYDLAVNTVYRMVKMDKIPYLRVGGGYRFDPDEIKKWEASSAFMVSPETLSSFDDPSHPDFIPPETRLKYFVPLYEIVLELTSQNHVAQDLLKAIRLHRKSL